MEQQAIIDALVIEKTALDQMCFQEVRNCLELRKQILVEQKNSQEHYHQVQKLTEEINALRSELSSLKRTLETAPIEQ